MAETEMEGSEGTDRGTVEFSSCTSELVERVLVLSTASNWSLQLMTYTHFHCLLTHTVHFLGTSQCTKETLYYTVIFRRRHAAHPNTPTPYFFFNFELFARPLPVRTALDKPKNPLPRQQFPTSACRGDVHLFN